MTEYDVAVLACEWMVIDGYDNHDLVHRFYDGTKWSGWINLGGDLG